MGADGLVQLRRVRVLRFWVGLDLGFQIQVRAGRMDIDYVFSIFYQIKKKDKYKISRKEIESKLTFIYFQFFLGVRLLSTRVKRKKSLLSIGI